MNPKKWRPKLSDLERDEESLKRLPKERRELIRYAKKQGRTWGLGQFPKPKEKPITPHFFDYVFHRASDLLIRTFKSLSEERSHSIVILSSVLSLMILGISYLVYIDSSYFPKRRGPESFALAGLSVYLETYFELRKKRAIKYFQKHGVQRSYKILTWLLFLPIVAINIIGIGFALYSLLSLF